MFHMLTKEYRVEAVQEILSRAGIFQGVDPVAVGNLIQQLETVRFPRGATIFEEGEPGDRRSEEHTSELQSQR